MPSERVQRKIDQLLEEAEKAIDAGDWPFVRARSEQALALDPENADAAGYLAAADRAAPRVSGGFPFPLGEGEGGGQLQVQRDPQQPHAGAGESPAPPGPAAAKSVGEGLVPSRPAPAGETPALPAAASAGPASFASGRYVVRKFLGEGGKKKVYLAHDTLLDRDVAFALIKTEGLDDAGRDRITREAQAMGRLGAHPHIVSVFDLGTERPLPLGEGQREGTPYIVTELMGGGDVEGLIEKAPEHRPPLEQTLEIGIQVCRGLEFAHAHGIVHRDLKPGNVWLTSPMPATHPSLPASLPQGERGDGSPRSSPRHLGEGEGVAKLGDFGLAVALDRSRLTQAGMMVGTVSYMPPEQALGGEVTPRSDLYSLGAMLYEMVTGRPPFVGDESVAIITQHLNTAPVSPSWHNSSVPPALEVLILRLLEKDATRRPASAAEVREALEAVQATGSRQRTTAGTAAGSLSLAGEDQGEGETRAAADAQAAPANPMYRRVFVGREAELRQLQAAYDAALSGEGSLAMVVGEPGIGKTSLCEQLATYAGLRGGRALVGHCYEEGSLSLPYLPFVEAMRSYVLARDPDGLRQDLGSGAGDVARLVSEIRDRLGESVGTRPHPDPLPQGEGRSLDPEEERWRLLQSVTAFLRNAASVQPLLLILEDLHDADRGTLDLLLHLSRNLVGARLLVVGTYRDVEVDRGHPLSGTLAELRRSASFQRIGLRGLTVDEVARMMNAIRGQEVPWSRAEAVHRQTEGNPLFIQEVLRYLVEEGLVIREGGRYMRTDGSEDPEAGIPEGLRDVIGKRLSHLSAQANQVLSVAAVVGRDFRLDVLQRVAGLSEDELDGALEEAAGRSLIEQRPVLGSLAFRFTHAFFRQTLYEEIFASRRLRLHQQVARALEVVYGRRLEEHAAELAEHYAQSTDAADLEKALEYCELAARRASAVFAYGEAVRHLEQALKVQEVLDPDDKAKRCDLLLAQGWALIPAGEAPRALESSAPKALAIAKSLGDLTRCSGSCQLALEALSWRDFVQGASIAESLQWLKEADRYALPGSRDRVLTDLNLAYREFFGNRRPVGLLLSQRALELAAALDYDEGFWRCVPQLLNMRLLHHQADRVRLAGEVVDRPQGGSSIESFSTGLWACCLALLSDGNRSEAERVRSRVEEIATRTKLGPVVLHTLHIDAILQAMDGRLEQVVQAAARLRDRANELGIPGRGEFDAFNVSMRSLCYIGRAEEALAAQPKNARSALAEGRSLMFGGDAAVCLAHLGRWPEVQEALAPLAEGMRTGDERVELSYVRLTNYLEAAVLAQDREATALIRARLEGAEGLIDELFITCVARHLGAAAALLGEPEQAMRYYEQALEVCAKVGFRPEIALTHLGIAELLLGDAGAMNRASTPGARGKAPAGAGGSPAPPGARAEALEYLDFAIAEFREMKMRPSLERALRHKEVLRA